MNKKESLKHYEVRLYKNNKFNTVKTNNFHPCEKMDMTLCYNGNRTYYYLVCEEKNILKTKQKIAKHFLKEAKKKLDVYHERVNLFTKILSEIK